MNVNSQIDILCGMATGAAAADCVGHAVLKGADVVVQAVITSKRLLLRPLTLMGGDDLRGHCVDFLHDSLGNKNLEVRVLKY